MPLDEEKVARRLPDAAAAAYLEAIDTPAARRLLPPGRIAGWADGRFGEDESPRWFDRVPAPREVFSLSTSSDFGFRRIAVLVFEKRMEVWWSDDPARWRTRPLPVEEGRALLDFLRKHRVDDLPPAPYLAVLTKGPAPDPALNKAGDWWPRNLSKSKPLTPYRP